MKILVYGAGPLGTLFAARLKQGGHEVSLLARGQRLLDLRQYGLVLEDGNTGQRTVTHLPVVESLAPEDCYELVLVIMRKNAALEILPTLAANQTPNILFLMNNAAGPGQLVEALGQKRALMGFPSSGGMFVNRHIVRYLGGSEEKKAVIPIGEVDGRIIERTRQVAAALECMPGYQVEIRKDMDAWLKTHVALLFPSIAPAIYAANLDRQRLAQTRDLLVLGVRAIREGLQVLKALHIPITPARINRFIWLPEPLLVAMGRRMFLRPQIEIALVGHAQAARSEVQCLVAEFLALKRQTEVATPAIDRLLPYLDPATPPMTAGSAQIPLRWW